MVLLVNLGWVFRRVILSVSGLICSCEWGGRSCVLLVGSVVLFSLSFWLVLIES